MTPSMAGHADSGTAVYKSFARCIAPQADSSRIPMRTPTRWYATAAYRSAGCRHALRSVTDVGAARLLAPPEACECRGERSPASNQQTSSLRWHPDLGHLDRRGRVTTVSTFRGDPPSSTLHPTGGVAHCVRDESSRELRTRQMGSSGQGRTATTRTIRISLCWANERLRAIDSSIASTPPSHSTRLAPRR